ncbi:hypothetical protein GGI03_008801, partial [Coemansia sp. RSA 2337]
REIARGKQVSWNSAGDMRAIQVVPISKAFNRECRKKTLDLASKPYVLEYVGKNQSDCIVFDKSLVAYALNGDICT